MKKLFYLLVLALILGLVLAGCSLLSNISQVPTTEQSGITYLTKSFSNLVGQWHFYDNALDSSVNSNDGDVHGATYVDGKFGRALSFDGVDDYVDCGNDASLDITTAITIEAWVYPRSAGKNNYGRITDKHPAPCLLVGPNGQLRWFGDIGGISVDKAVCTDCVSWNSWHHLALTYDMNEATPTIRGYVDGELKGTITGYSGPLSTTSVHLTIGNSLEEGTAYYLNRAFDGLIDEVRIWNTALSLDQLGKVYDFDGFFRPIDNDGVNAAKAGRAIPVKFSLNGDQGSDIFESGYPKSIPITCNGEESEGQIEETVTAGDSSLNYDADADQYIYVWKTDESWMGCRRLEVKLKDGTSYFADFKFK
jgi:hypothetical protein